MALNAATIARKVGKAEWEKDILALEIPLLQALDFRIHGTFLVFCISWGHCLTICTVKNPHDAVAALLEKLELKSVDRSAVDAKLQALLTTGVAILLLQRVHT